jgi:dipeptidyl aminopeptidase/acylaminoacyl peptidase
MSRPDTARRVPAHASGPVDPGRGGTPPRRRRPGPVAAPIVALVGLVLVAAASMWTVSVLGVFEGAGDRAATRGGPRSSIDPGASGDALTWTPHPTAIVTPPPDERPTVKGTLLFARDGDLWAASGLDLRQLSNKGTDSDPAWSPDGSRVYFVQTGSVEKEPPWKGAHYTLYPTDIMSMNADGTGRTKVLGSLFKTGLGSWFVTAVQPDVSPDGRTIALVSDDGFVPRSKESDWGPVVVSTMSTSGKGLKALPNVPDESGMGHNDPAWSPDGRTLAFVVNDMSGVNGTPRIGLFDVATKKTTVLKKGYASPAWSPDGRWLVAERTTGVGRDIVVLDARTGAEVVRLTNDGSSFRPTWSPDGDQIAYLHRDGLDIDLRLMTMDLTRGLTLVSDRPITEDGTLDAASTPAWFIPAEQRRPMPTQAPAPPPTGTPPDGPEP